MTKISTGVAFLDAFLDGGYDHDIITTIYGPAGSGKTNLCLLAAAVMAKQKKVIIIDTEGGIAVERIRQISGAKHESGDGKHSDEKYKEILERLLFFHPVTFDEQKEIFEKLRGLVNEHIGLIIVDSISMLYRLELGKSEEVYDVNSSLGKQIAYLVEIARRKKIPVLITNQVYSEFDNRDKVKMVGGDLLKYGSKCLIELQKFANCWGLTLQKHRSLPTGKELKFRIVQQGIERVEIEKAA